MLHLLEQIGAFVIARCEAFGTVVLLYAETMRQLRHRPRVRHILAQTSLPALRRSPARNRPPAKSFRCSLTTAS